MQTATCWGSGQLNVMRASETSMQAVLVPALTRLEISRLIVARNKIAALSIDAVNPGIAPAKNADAIGALLAQAQIDAKVRNRLSISTGSTCHSLRITLVDHRRAWYRLTVSDESKPNRPRVDSIVW